jgi:anti-anti-sigma factor
MNLKVSDHKDIKIVYLSGRLDVTLAGEVEAELEKLIEAGTCKMILDLQQLDCLSSSGIRVFIAISRRLNQKKGKLVFCQMTPQIIKLIKIIELDDVFEIHNSLYEAFSAFDA